MQHSNIYIVCFGTHIYFTFFESTNKRKMYLLKCFTAKIDILVRRKKKHIYSKFRQRSESFVNTESQILQEVSRIIEILNFLTQYPACGTHITVNQNLLIEKTEIYKNRGFHRLVSVLHKSDHHVDCIFDYPSRQKISEDCRHD